MSCDFVPLSLSPILAPIYYYHPARDQELTAAISEAEAAVLESKSSQQLNWSSIEYSQGRCAVIQEEKDLVLVMRNDTIYS